MTLSSALRQALPPGTVQALRPLNRVRWIAKARQVRDYHADWRADPRGVLAYVLWDPEVGDYSYDLSNREDFAAGLAVALGETAPQVRAWFDEAERQPELAGRFEQRLRHRRDLHHRPQLGPRIGWYALVRAVRPRLVVETGIKHGIGALVLLVALERNAADGHPGALISIDDDPAAGSLVPSGRFMNWQRVTGRSPDDLEPAIGGRPVDVLIHDTPPVAGVEAGEYALALASPAEDVWLVSGSNGAQTPVLADLAAAHGAAFHMVDEVPRHPVYPGAGMALARIRRPPASGPG